MTFDEIGSLNKRDIDSSYTITPGINTNNIDTNQKIMLSGDVELDLDGEVIKVSELAMIIRLLKEQFPEFSV